MKNSLKKVLSVICVLSLTVTMFGMNSKAVSQYTLSGTVMTNEYLSLSVSSSNGRFTIGTTEGNPDITTDNNKKMLYGWPSTGTSYTTVVVDNNVKKYGDDGFTQAPAFDTANGSNTSVATYGDITVRQILSVINNNSTDREDVVEIKYEVTNNGTQSHNFGTRIMLDTMLGGNDHAPFRIPDVGSVTTQTEFTGDSIPQYWQAFDSLTDPKVVAQGSFLRSNTNKPDKVQFTNWAEVSNTAWNCPISAGSSNGDSAVTVTWYSKPIAAGETKTYVTHYGLSELVQDLKPPLAVSLYGDSTISISNGTYSPNPITLTAYIQNIGNGNAENVRAVLVLPNSSNLSINNTDHVTENIGTLIPGQEHQCSWKINVKSVSAETIEMIGVKVVADGLEDKTLIKYITIPAIGKDNRILWGSQKRNGSWTGVDNLSFINSPDNFFKRTDGNNWKDYNYHISDEYFNMLANGMSNTVWTQLNNKRNATWGGSCYGMSCVVSLTKNGNLTPSNYKSRAKVAHDLNKPVDNKKVENLVNFYQLMCQLPDWQDIIKTFSNSSVEESTVLRDLVSEVRKVQNGGLPVVICYSWRTNELDENNNHKGGGHAVIGYELAEVSEQINDVTYRYRVSICDPNKSAYSYLYISSDFKNWQYPGGLNTTGDGNNDSVWIENGVEHKTLYAAISTLNLIDLINPETGTNRTIMKNYNSNFISSYSSPNFYVLDETGNRADSQSLYSADGSNLYTYLANGNTFRVIPEVENEDICCSLVLSNSSVDINASNVNSLSVKSNGEVSFSGNDSNCNLSLTLNDEILPLNYFRLNISGDNINSYSTSVTSDGVVLAGDNLSNTTVVATNRSQSAKVTIATDETSVMLRDVDEDTIGVYVDQDHNGSYETEIAQSEIFESSNDTSFWANLLEFFRVIIDFFKQIFGLS